ncbi:MAG TPA: ATP-grasp domain-containing protein [Gaiellaceae bacterium]|jgi:biotin carboxylase|nr:ATP-grasp domain-containing protein [Gaiellaceae bacterium]
MKTVLFVGAGRHQRRALRRARELGLRVAAIDRNADAPGFTEADVTETVDFADVDDAVAAARRIGPDGVVTVASDRAVPVAALIAEELDLPGIGSDTARVVTNKVAMRMTLAEAGVPQPRFAPVRTLDDAQAALPEIGLPAVLKPADSAGQRGIALVRAADELEQALDAALAESRTGDAILERFHEGAEINCLAIARGGEVSVLTLSDRQRPGGDGFGVCLAHVYPADLDADAAEAERVAAAAVRAAGLVDTVAYPQVLVSADGVRLVEIAARVPAGLMDEVSRLGIGVDLVEIALRQALGEDVPDELLRPRVRQPLAIRFWTAEPGPLPTGVVRSVNGIEHALAAPGVVAGESYLSVGETIRPARVDGDRRGYVIALGETRDEALARADAAASLVEVEVA